MVNILEWSKQTLRTRAQPRRPQSAMPHLSVTPADNSPPTTPRPTATKRSSLFLNPYSLRGEKKYSPIVRDDHPRSSGSSQLDETMSIFRKLKKSRSLKALELPPIPHLKPMTMTNLLGDDKSSGDEANAPSKRSVTRKPVPQRSMSVSTPFYAQRCAPHFDPQEPLYNSDMHVSARSALKKRYQSKLAVDFEVPNGLSVRDYDFRWVDPEELDSKVLDDIVWVRRRYAQAGKGEPSDKEIIWWYDAEEFDEGKDIGVAL